jgi:Inner membrane protein YgaP-like, transmembrane domain
VTLEYAVRLLAGSLVLVGLILGLTVSPWFFILVGFVGVNLVQSSFTGWCLAEKIMARMGVGRTAASRG